MMKVWHLIAYEKEGARQAVVLSADIVGARRLASRATNIPEDKWEERQMPVVTDQPAVVFTWRSA